MSALFNTININESIHKQKFDNSLSENDKSVLRKQFIQIIPSCFIAEKKQTNYYIPSTLRTKSQSEELNKLQSEIAVMEEKISALEINKKQKLNKVILPLLNNDIKIDDLRHLIRRVANEDCFIQQQCVFSNATSQAFNRTNQTRERCDKKNRKFAKSNDRTMGSSNTTSTSSTDQTGEEDPQGDVNGNEGICGDFKQDGASGKHGDLQGYYRSDDSSDDCLLQAMAYWQEYLPSPSDNSLSKSKAKAKVAKEMETMQQQCFMP